MYPAGAGGRTDARSGPDGALCFLRMLRQPLAPAIRSISTISVKPDSVA